MRLHLPLFLSFLLATYGSIRGTSSANFKSLNSLAIQDPENSPVLPRSLVANETTSCSVPNCNQCDLNLLLCESCFNGYKLISNSCVVSSKGSDQSISLVGLVVMIVCLSIFFLLFCVLCIFFARKYRPKYSGGQYANQDHTKSASSIMIDSTPEDVRSRSELVEPVVASPSALVNNVDIRLRLLTHLFKSLTTLPKSEGMIEDCPICFASLNSRRLKRFGCEHLTHYRCCKDWILAWNEKCPVCLRIA